jgi:hypothetical protein
MSRLLMAMLLLVLSALPVSAAGASELFGQGNTHFGLVAGNGYAFDESYFVIGASATYYVIDGLGVGLSIENWSGSSPGMTKYSPYLQYVYYQASKVKPYLGGFYRDTAISGQPSIYSYGSRAGIYVSSGRSAYFGAGFVHESYLDCDTKVYSTCSETYPEISFIFAF